MKPLQALLVALTAILIPQAGLMATPAQDGTLVFSDEGPTAPAAPTKALVAPFGLVAHLPSAPTMAAPAWVKPGARITIWVGSATYMGSGNMTTLVPDPNGNLVKKNGQRVRKSTAGGGAGGPAGAGFMQIDIISASSEVVLMDVRTFTGDGQVSKPHLSMVTGQAAHPGSCEYWIHPTLLQQLKLGPCGPWNVLKGTWPVQDRTYNAVVFQNAEGHVVYDLDSGVCLGLSHGTDSTSTHTQLDPNTGRYGPATSNNRSMSESYFVGIRQLNLPWASDGIEAQALNYEGGTFRGELVVTPNYGQPGSPLAYEMSVLNRGIGWFGAQILQVMNGEKAPMNRFTAATQVGGLCMNPKSLANLQQGQVIDQDPVTGYRTHVEFKGSSNQGQAVVGIVEEGPGGLVRWVYSATTGELVGTCLVNPLPEGLGAAIFYTERVR